MDLYVNKIVNNLKSSEDSLTFSVSIKYLYLKYWYMPGYIFSSPNILMDLNIYVL